MRVLPTRKDIDKSKQIERKQEIDAGIALATKVDKLREVKAQEEKNLKDWRDANISKIQYEIAQFIETKDNLEKQCNEAREVRDKLLEPLNKEWAEINQEKIKLTEEKQEVYFSQERLKAEESKIQKEKEKVSIIILKAKKNEYDSKKAKEESVSLKDLAQNEYEMARSQRISQTDMHDRAMSEAHKLQEAYQNGLNIIAREEQAVKEKEEELIIRENKLATQQVALRLVYEEITKNGTIHNTIITS